MIAREHREIPIDLVDEPEAPTRLHIDPTKMDELMRSIQEHGQLQPGGVVTNGERFVVSYGHRRLLACRALELPTYSAYVYQSDTVAMLACQLDENVIRHDLNAVEEAYWFAQLLDAIGGDCDELALMLDKNREYVESRLLLLRGDADVLEALKVGNIKLGVAKILNAYAHDGDRRVLLDAAVAGGASERLVRSWIQDRVKLNLAVTGVQATDAAAGEQPASTFEAPALTCLFCDSDQEVYLMVPVYVHKTCLGHLTRILAKHLGGAAHVEVPKPVGRS